MKRSPVITLVLVATLIFLSSPAFDAYAHMGEVSGPAGHSRSGTVKRAWLGVVIQDLTPEIARSLGLEGTKGVLVSDVTRNGPADRAGIKREDVIIEVDGQKVEGVQDLLSFLGKASPGQEVSIKLLRNGKEMVLTASLGSREEAMAGRQGMGHGMMGPENFGEMMGRMMGQMMERMMKGMMQGMKGMMGKGMEACPSMGHMGGHKGYGHHGHSVEMLKERLGLSEEQVEKAKEMERAYRKEAIRLHSDIEIAEIDLKALLDQEPVDMARVEEKVKEIEGKRARLRLERIRFYRDLMGILTPDQKKAFKEMGCF